MNYEDFKAGKFAFENDGSVEQLREATKKNDWLGYGKYYTYNDGTSTKPDLPIIKVTDYLKEKETLFKVGDVVYHFRWGKGKFIELSGDKICIVEFENKKLYIFKDELSFTPYNLLDGGFSQVRPLPEIEHLQQVWVSANKSDWTIEFFKEFKNGKILTHRRLNKDGGIGFREHNYYSIKNPLVQ